MRTLVVVGALAALLPECEAADFPAPTTAQAPSRAKTAKPPPNVLLSLLREQRSAAVRRCADRAARGQFAGPQGAMGSFRLTVRVDAHGQGGRAETRVLTDSDAGFGQCLAEVAASLSFPRRFWGRDLAATVHLGERP